ncbi:MAG TPA: glycosyltransferase family 9 protein [bacterium]|nr:glycosyltransferase family 9 protein [bacterium]
MDIFLLRLDRIGDFILGIPAYRALREAHPHDRISVVVPSAAAELARSCPYFDEVYVFEARWLMPGEKPRVRWRSAWQLIHFLRPKRVDLLINFRYQNRLDPLVTGLSGAKKSVGFDHGFWSRFLTTAVPQPLPGTHQVRRNLLPLEALGIRTHDLSLGMWWDERDEKRALEHLPRQESLPGLPRLGIHLGAATPAKRWGEEDFAALIHELQAATEGEILVFGGEEDLPFAHEVLDGLKAPVVNLVGKLTLRQMASLIAGCRAFVGCDTGPTHLAAAVGTPVVSLFSAANEAAVWKPWGEKVKVLTRQPSCSPCQSYACRRTDGYFCMREIKVEEVVEAVKGFLAPR